MNRSPVLTTLLLSIGLISATAQSAENVNADLTTGLNQVGVISVQGVVGEPHDVERLIALKADEQGASYYRILSMNENMPQHTWHVTAALYS